MGGRGGAHTAANLVLLCGTANSPGGCHLRCEHDDLDAARSAGFRLRPGEDPETAPILRHGVSWVLPTSEGWLAAPAPS
jgi:5-methylcytosine-specific restriction protein A